MHEPKLYRYLCLIRSRLVAWVAAERFKFCLAVVLRPKQTRKFAIAPALDGRTHLRLAESFSPRQKL